MRVPGARRWVGRAERLEEAAEAGRGQNNFDLLRLLAAGCVLLGHSFDLLVRHQPFFKLENVSWGAIGVLVFFCVSGFLVARSWDTGPRVLAFAIKRALRLLPALAVALLLTAFVLGPLVTNLPVPTYLGALQT
jgi:peptidoglycan/LPS O-acetylase OafA/YrhL